MDANGKTQTFSARYRPFDVPDRLRDLDGPLDGVVDLPTHVRWSDPPRSYDMARRTDRIAVYEQVLEEGSLDDIRRFVSLHGLVEVWDDLYLPVHIRSAWAERLEAELGPRPWR